VTRAFSVIVAADEARGIGRGGDLPWRLPGDMAFYKRTTTDAPAGLQNAVVMGRRTFESIPLKFRPLKQRLNVVVSRDQDYAPAGVLRASSLPQALALLEARADVAHTFIVGGARLYAEALHHPACSRVLLTRVHARFDCDTFLAPFEHDFVLERREGPLREPDDAGAPAYTFETYLRRP
jgi:dihydrofolate reductase